MTPSPLIVHRAPGSNTYCVPACLSALLGRSVDDIMPLLAEHLGDQPITGLYIPIAVRILRDAGCKVNELTYANVFTLNQLSKRLPASRMFLVTTCSHALVMSGRLIIDNQQPNGIEARAYAYKRARVEQCFEVVR